ncbi:DNA-protecting protein DprA, partial [Microbacterium aerolatum]|uniref:DNA-processing protein DprA n=1 Tax=Microbacterium aerolatum TaxID=153731 RepID=UPI002001B09F
MLLAIVAEPNHPSTGGLLADLGGIETVKLIESSSSVPGMEQVAAAVWRDRARNRITVDRVAEIMAESDRFELVTPADQGWPVQLNDLRDRAPYGLWTRGDAGLLKIDRQHVVTFSGARAATGYGQHVTEELAGDLAYRNVTIVAGGSYGIEGAAQSSALSRGRSTIAVLASGLDRPYPSGHADLFDRIGQSGLIVSEVPPGSAPTRQRLIDRSRLLAAFSAATVIIEAGTRSGTIHVATEAESLGRRLGAVPGPVTSVIYGLSSARALFLRDLPVNDVKDSSPRSVLRSIRRASKASR